MAYTYDEFVNSATKSGVMGQFSRDDLAAAQKNPEYGLSMVSLMRDAGGAKTPEQRILATEAANQLRKNYGVSNGSFGQLTSTGYQITGGTARPNTANPTGSFGQLGSNGYQITGGTARPNTAYPNGSNGQLSSSGYQITGGTGKPNASYPTGGNYQSQIQSLLWQLGSYGPYSYDQQAQLQQVMDQIGKYGSFEYSKQDQLQNVLGQIAGYGPYEYGQQDQLQDALDKVNNYGEFTYGNETIYQQLLNGLLKQEAFQYDHTQDPSFSAYKKAYLREGERAGANAMAQAAAASGGIPSSYALQAAQQANNYYAGQLADVIPALEQQAYQRYQGDISNWLNNLNVLQADRAQAQNDWQTQYNMLLNFLGNLQSERNFDYQGYLDRFGQLQGVLGSLESDRAQEQGDWQTQYNMLLNFLGNLQSERNFDYQKYLDQFSQTQAMLDNYRNQDNTDYSRYMDQLQLKREDEQTAYERALEEQLLKRENEQTTYERALDQYQILGYITPEMSEILGLPATELPKETTPTTPGGPGPAADEGLGDTPLDGNSDNNDMITQLKGLYPGGAVPDATTWSYLAAMYGEDVLKAAGLYYREKVNNTIPNGNPGGGKRPVAVAHE